MRDAHRIEVLDPKSGWKAEYCVEPTRESAVSCLERVLSAYRSATANGSLFSVSAIAGSAFEVRRTDTGDVVVIYRLAAAGAG
jgi:hypothetical protein